MFRKPKRFQLNTPVDLLKQEFTVKFKDGTTQIYSLYEYVRESWTSRERYTVTLSDLKSYLEQSILQGKFYYDRKGLAVTFYSVIKFENVERIHYHGTSVYDQDETVTWIDED